MFPKIDAKRFNIHDDQKMVLDFLLQEKVLLVQGSAFNWPWPDHVRIVTLPREDDLEMAITRFGRFLSGYHQYKGCGGRFASSPLSAHNDSGRSHRQG